MVGYFLFLLFGKVGFTKIKTLSNTSKLFNLFWPIRWLLLHSLSPFFTRFSFETSMKVILTDFSSFPLLTWLCSQWSLIKNLIFWLLSFSLTKCNGWFIVGFKNSWLFLLHFLYIGHRSEVIFTALLWGTCFHDWRFRSALFYKFLFLFGFFIELGFAFIRTFFDFSIVLYVLFLYLT